MPQACLGASRKQIRLASFQRLCAWLMGSSSCGGLMTHAPDHVKRGISAAKT
jgi:hypothetical protein